MEEIRTNPKNDNEDPTEISCTNCKELFQWHRETGICKIHNIQVDYTNYCEKFKKISYE
jgi:hypothetical protein